MSLAPKLKNQKRQERVLDARICMLSGCRYMQSSVHPLSQRTVYSCGAGVYRSQIPTEELHREISRNPSPIPGADSDSNPFLLRLLMAPECLRPECGVAQIEYIEKVLEVDPEEIEAGLFS